MTERMIDELKSFGFMLSDDFVAKVLASANSPPSQKPIMKPETKGEEEEEEGSSRLNFRNIQEFRTYLLNTDFRRNPPCVAPYLPADALSTQKSMKLTGPVVLQILTVNNIAVASKRRYEDYHTKFLSIVLTDGHTKIHAVEIEPIPGLKPTTPPGSKILFQGGEVIKGKILLTSVNSRFLGGEVKHLIESFQANLHAIKYREMEYGSKGGKQLSRVENPPKFEFDLLLKLQAASSLKPPPVDNRAQKATTENKTKETGPSQQQQNQNQKQLNRKDESTEKQESRNQNNKKQMQTNVNNDQIQDNKPQKQNNDKKNHKQQAKANDLQPQESSKINTTSNQGQKKEASNQKQEQPKAELVDGAQNNKRDRNSNQNQRKHQEKDAGVTKIPANAQSDSHVPKVTEMVPQAQGSQKREKSESRTYTRADNNNNTEVAPRPQDLEDKRRPSNNRRGNEGGKQNSNSNSNKVGEAQSSTIALPPPPPTISDTRASVPENNSRGKNQNNKRSQPNVVPPLAPEETSSQEKADSHLPQPSAVKEGGRQRDNRNQRNRSDRTYDRKVDDLSQSLASVSIQPVVDTQVSSNPGPNPRGSRLNTTIAKNLISSSLGVKEKQENSMPSQAPNPAPIPVSIAPDRKAGGDIEPQNPDAARGNSRGGRGGNHYRRGGRGGGRGSSEPVQG